jgi:hypothetical protein
VFQLVLPSIAVAEMTYRLRSDLGLSGTSVMVITWTTVLVTALAFAALLVVRHVVAGLR